MSVNATVIAGVTVSESIELAAGAKINTTVRLPVSSTPISYADGAGAGQVGKQWVDKRTYAASPVTLDLTSLSAAATNSGDASFSKIKILAIYNDATASGFDLTVGAADSAAFGGPLGGTDPTITLGPGEAIVLYSRTAAGWDCATAKNLKLDPGSNNVPATVVLAGN